MSTLRVGAVVIVAAIVVAAWMLTRSTPSTYRTSVVRTGTVEATLDSVGTIAPVNQSNLAFGTSGTVAAVDVSVGSAVTAGQTVASLDPTQLNAAVVSAQATLAAAQATLAAAEVSQSAPASSGAPPSPTTTTPTPSSRSGQSSSNAQQIAKLQANLVADQTQEDADSTAASQSLAAATSLCEAAPSGGSTGAAASAGGAGPTPSAGSSPTSPTTTGTGAPITCAQALAQASAAQAKVAADIKQVTQDESALNAALQPASGGSAASGAQAAPIATTTAFVSSSAPAVATDVASVGTSPSGSASGSGSSRSGAPATAQQLAVDQAAVDTAQAKLTDAQQALGDVNLVSTISGTVASVSIAAGDSVTSAAGSANPEIVVIGPGSSYQLVTQVPVADIDEVAVGQTASVTPDATNSLLPGTVTSIGLLPVSGTTGTTYPVTISLTSGGLGLFSGADAEATIVVDRSDDVTAVPTSAVRMAGSVHVVTVVDGGTTKTARVTLGTVGDVLTQITSGLKPGDVVALADLGQPLPTTSTGVTGRFGGLGGGAGGGAGGAGIPRSVAGGGGGGLGFVGGAG